MLYFFIAKKGFSTFFVIKITFTVIFKLLTATCAYEENTIT